MLVVSRRGLAELVRKGKRLGRATKEEVVLASVASNLEEELDDVVSVDQSLASLERQGFIFQRDEA